MEELAARRERMPLYAEGGFKNNKSAGPPPLPLGNSNRDNVARRKGANVQDNLGGTQNYNNMAVNNTFNAFGATSNQNANGGSDKKGLGMASREGNGYVSMEPIVYERLNTYGSSSQASSGRINISNNTRDTRGGGTTDDSTPPPLMEVVRRRSPTKNDVPERSSSPQRLIFPLPQGQSATKNSIGISPMNNTSAKLSRTGRFDALKYLMSPRIMELVSITNANSRVVSSPKECLFQLSIKVTGGQPMEVYIFEWKSVPDLRLAGYLNVQSIRSLQREARTRFKILCSSQGQNSVKEEQQIIVIETGKQTRCDKFIDYFTEICDQLKVTLY
eukprot:TRINITY_DN5517_c0_g3_i1.p1 TRINITY_DN5517_c0_g3~~TRINITY_DN5517_c0_g3_i1.p1  ORF type:complete len:331 (+),score=27.41 TRINITY_DN5517_c0_g3_i1:221-1213(+)